MSSVPAENPFVPLFRRLQVDLQRVSFDSDRLVVIRARIRGGFLNRSFSIIPLGLPGPTRKRVHRGSRSALALRLEGRGRTGCHSLPLSESDLSTYPALPPLLSIKPRSESIDRAL